jgi:hypothetical protein
VGAKAARAIGGHLAVSWEPDADHDAVVVGTVGAPGLIATNQPPKSRDWAVPSAAAMRLRLDRDKYGMVR